MSSMIERLSKKAIEQVNAELKEPSPDFWIEVYNKKFAGLIVEECAKIGELKEQGDPSFARDVSVGWYMKKQILENIKAGADIHAGDGGYGIGTQEKYEEFVKVRNQSLLNNYEFNKKRDEDRAAWSDILSDGGMDPRN